MSLEIFVVSYILYRVRWLYRFLFIRLFILGYGFKRDVLFLCAYENILYSLGDGLFINCNFYIEVGIKEFFFSNGKVGFF